MNILKQVLYKNGFSTNSLTILFISFIFVIAGCSSNYRSSIIDPKANINSSMEELIGKGGDKSIIIKALDSKIANMELFRVVDYTKKYIMPDDYGYGIFYDLKKENAEGSGNIYLYKRDNCEILNDISSEAINEIKIEQQILQKKEILEFNPKIKEINGIKFYESIFVTPPDSNNEKFESFLYITGFNKNYVKIIFFYPEGSDYSNKETGLFLESLVKKIRSIKKE